MRRTHVLVLCAAVAVASVAKAEEEFKLPPEVTPSMRAACESDVRRLCIGKSPTVARVKRCVAAKFMQLGRRCQFELASAGLSAASR